MEELFGLKGSRHGLLIRPQLPSYWNEAKVTREFRGATLHVEIRRETGISRTMLIVDGRTLPANKLTDIRPGKTYKLQVKLPAHAQCGSALP